MSCILPFTMPCCQEEYCDDILTVGVPGPPGEEGPPGVTNGEMAGWFIRDTAAQARAIPNDLVNKWLNLLGSATKGDSYGGFFYWDQLSILTDNYSDYGGSVIAPSGSSGSGRWLRYL
jgi:hypothetical protein